MDEIDTFLDALDLRTDIETERISRSELAMLVGIRRLIHQQGERTMASLDNLTAAVATLGADVETAAADVTAAIDDLKAQIAALTAGGTISQDQIDALTASVTGADEAVDALDASVKAPPAP